MTTATEERRKRARKKPNPGVEVRIEYQDQTGETREAAAKLIDFSDTGIGVETRAPLPAAAEVVVTSRAGGDPGKMQQARARVVACALRPGGLYRVGLTFEAAGFRARPEFREEAGKNPIRDSFVDFYEVLQVSPNADGETIHRVYRMLAHRFHPDNKDSGDEEAFKQLMNAYQTLNDPERRAAYDVEHGAARRRWWKIFDQPKAARGREGEKRVRRGVLSLLATKRMHEPDQPGMTIKEIEEMLACPREHLEFSLWYLKESQWIGRTDNGRHFITAKGIDAEETEGVAPIEADRLLPAPQRAWTQDRQTARPV